MVTVLRSGPKCVNICSISDRWPFCLFTLTVLLPDHWSYASIPMLISFMYTKIFLLFFTVLLLKLQYEILVCQMKISSRGNWMLACICLQRKMCSPLFSRSRSMMDRWPNKTWEHRKFVLHFIDFMWNNRDFVRVWSGLSSESVQGHSHITVLLF